MVYPLLIVVIIWLCFFIDHGYGLSWYEYGVQPHEIKGLIGIVSMPFLHGNFDHLFSNSIPLLISLALIFLYFKESKWQIVVIIYLFSGLLLWIIADNNTNHIGASGLVYGYIAFMVTHAFINKNKESLAAAFVLIFLYGSLIYGIFPDYGKLIGKNISWEGHLAGMIIGIITAFIYRRRGPQAYHLPDEEDDEDPPDWFPTQEHDNQKTTIHYHFKPTEDKNSH